jgi:hypothetical protein
MTELMIKRILLISLFLLALAGFMLHYRVHPFIIPDILHPGMMIFNKTNFLGFIFPLIDVVAVTLLFMSRKTVLYGYVLNGLIVMYGTIFMAHFSIADFIARPIPPVQWIIKSTLPDIAIAWADFFIGKALFDFSIRQNNARN